MSIAELKAAVQLIRCNDPLHGDYSATSYVAHATDDARHDDEAYWRLEWALVLITGHDPPADLLASVFAVFERVSLLTRCHFDPQDVFRFDNLSDDQVRNLDDRLRAVCSGVFDGKPPRRDAFDVVNPYWRDSGSGEVADEIDRHDQQQ